ncbi:hypothetical protein AVEN_68783-1 [Araneus ventricosus]|uniref:Reverse transcriptase domain-containing protein n=1 Tax=Araneus ventricosus TaxID=182803 RepID=A0A4Y2C579_ARAVE|nr:hypothetical protein AVEN_68783-1 [Araneus ventricosus]
MQRSLPCVWEAVQSGVRKSVFPTQIPYLMNGEPKGSLQEAAQDNLDQIFLSHTIPTNYNLTTSTQLPDPPFSPKKSRWKYYLISERRNRPAAGVLLSSYFTPTDNREGAGETYDSEADLSSRAHQQPERPIAWLQRRKVCGYSHQRANKQNSNSKKRWQESATTDLQDRATRDQEQGCPQGSCSGPALWNLVAHEILNQVWPDNVHIQAFAYNFVLVIEADTKKTL